MSNDRVLLIGMPFASTERPNLSIALLQAHLRRAGIACDARYASLELARRAGFEMHELATLGPMVGEWLFVRALHGETFADAGLDAYRSFLARVLGNDLTPELWERLLGVRDLSDAYLEELVDDISWDDYDAIGFSVVFQQTISSLALAQRVKQLHPDLPILFGGPNMHGSMGVALHEKYDCIDIAATGEADDIIVDLFAAAARGEDVGHLPGIVHRRNGASIVNEPAAAVGDMDALPFPDFDQWFEQQEAAGFGERRSLTLETSRGCWWGAISHCTFCGLNGSTMSYRSKSPERAYREIDELYEKYDADFITVADNILDMRYLRSLLPRLAARRPRVSIYFEIRPKLRRHHVAQLAAAGVDSVLPGIESFSDRSLDLMGKATTGLECIQLLKHLAEFDIAVDWNYLIGTPGETIESHRAAEPLLEACRHLSPPKTINAIQIHRFSPFHERPEELGFVNLRAESVYGLLHPFDAETLDRIAYVFDADYAEGAEESLEADGIRAIIERWSDPRFHGGLWELDADPDVPDTSSRADLARPIEIVDQRNWRDRTPRTTLRGWRAVVFRSCDSVATEAELLDAVAAHGVDLAGLGAFLDWAVALGYLVSDGDRYVSVTVHHPPRVDVGPLDASSRRRIPVAVLP